MRVSTKGMVLAALVAGLGMASPIQVELASADVMVWQGAISEDQVKNGGGGAGQPDGSTDSPGSGELDIRYDLENDYLYFNINWEDLQSDITKLHVHGPADASASNMAHVFDIFNDPSELDPEPGATKGRVSDNLPFIAQLLKGSPSFTAEVALGHMEDELAYVNVHSVDFPMGEIRGNLVLQGTLPTASKDQQKCWTKLAKGADKLLKAQARQLDYCIKHGAAGDLSAWAGISSEDQVKNGGGGAGQPDGSTDSPGTGEYRIVYNAANDDFAFFADWENLQSAITKLHVHGPVDENGSTMLHLFDIFNDPNDFDPTPGLTSGSVQRTTSFIAQLLTGTPSFTKEVALQHMSDDMGYFNIHTVDFPMGEIRGNLVSVAAVEACLLEDFGGQRAKAEAQLEELLAEDCAGANFPDFGVAPSDFAGSAVEAAQQSSAGYAAGLFGSNLGDALINAATDKDAARCQAIVTKKASKCAAARSKAFQNCAKAALKGKKTVAAVDEEAFEYCLSLDSKGKIAKACSDEDGSLGKIVAKRCTGDLQTLFPGAAEDNLTALMGDLDSSFACASCEAANATFGLAADCDELDNGAVDSSCN